MPGPLAGSEGASEMITRVSVFWKLITQWARDGLNSTSSLRTMMSGRQGKESLGAKYTEKERGGEGQLGRCCFPGLGTGEMIIALFLHEPGFLLGFFFFLIVSFTGIFTATLQGSQHFSRLGYQGLVRFRILLEVTRPGSDRARVKGIRTSSPIYSAAH